MASGPLFGYQLGNIPKTKASFIGKEFCDFLIVLGHSALVLGNRILEQKYERNTETEVLRTLPSSYNRDPLLSTPYGAH